MPDELPDIVEDGFVMTHYAEALQKSKDSAAGFSSSEKHPRQYANVQRAKQEQLKKRGKKLLQLHAVIALPGSHVRDNDAISRSQAAGNLHAAR
jgi:hypothetical protein